MYVWDAEGKYFDFLSTTCLDQATHPKIMKRFRSSLTSDTYQQAFYTDALGESRRCFELFGTKSPAMNTGVEA